MEEIDSSPTSPNPRKRAAPDEDSPEKKPLNLKGTQFMMPTPPDTDQSSNASPTCTAEAAARQASPASSSSTLTSVEYVSSNPIQSSSNAAGLTSTIPQASGSGPPPAKKRKKLTPAEKEQQAKEKAARDAGKAEQKAKKDEDKRVKDEQKRKNAEEREAKKRDKELEEERKAQDKLKKERAQMRLGVWFQKPATPVESPGSGEGPSNSARRKSLSLEPFDAVMDQIRASASPCKGAPQSQAEKKTPAKTPTKAALSDYRKHFLPFQLKTYTSMPPLHTVEDPEAAQEAFDRDVNDASLREKYDLGLVDSYASLERQFSGHRGSSRGLQLPSMRQVVDQIQGFIRPPIDLTSDEPPENPMDVLQTVSRRYLEFDEDVRPAYFGTYTKIRSPGATRKLCRNPLSRKRVDTDYDYDSEAEWEEPEEGEDIVDEEDDEAESLGDANEMDEFLDDEEDALKSKRKMISGDLVPASTGLCWEDESGEIMPSIEGSSPSQVVRDMRMGVLLHGFSGSTIDPFSTVYWQTDPIPVLAPVPAAEPTVIFANGLMAPPRPPLQPRPNTNATLDHVLVGAAEGMKGPITSVAATQGSKNGRKPTPKTLSKEDLDEFKEAVVGSQLGKADMMKGLKARFPKLTNDTIKMSLGEHFAQVGSSKAEKKWVFVSGS